VNALPVWIDARAMLFLHDESLAMFGGARGLRDAGLFESALPSPVNQHLYKPDSDIAELAAAYALSLAKNHPFVAGNERTAFLALGVFLGPLDPGEDPTRKLEAAAGDGLITRRLPAQQCPSLPKCALSSPCSPP
jgi:hypothetical protein